MGELDGGVGVARVKCEKKRWCENGNACFSVYTAMGELDGGVTQLQERINSTIIVEVSNLQLWL